MTGHGVEDQPIWYHGFMNVMLFVLTVSRWARAVFDIYFNTWVYPAVVLSLASVVALSKTINEPDTLVQTFLWKCLWLTFCWCIGRSIAIGIEMWRLAARK